MGSDEAFTPRHPSQQLVPEAPLLYTTGKLCVGALQAPESTVGQPMAVCRQGTHVEYSVEYSKCRALNGIPVSTPGLGALHFESVEI